MNVLEMNVTASWVEKFLETPTIQEGTIQEMRVINETSWLDFLHSRIFWDYVFDGNYYLLLGIVGFIISLIALLFIMIYKNKPKEMIFELILTFVSGCALAVIFTFTTLDYLITTYKVKQIKENIITHLNVNEQKRFKLCNEHLSIDSMLKNKAECLSISFEEKDKERFDELLQQKIKDVKLKLKDLKAFKT